MRKNNTGNGKTIGWLWKVSGRGKWNVFYLLLVQVYLGISSVGTAWLLSGMIDGAVAKNVTTFAQYAAAFAGVVLSQIICRGAVRFLEENGKSTMENTFKGRLLSTLMSKDYAAVTAVHSGEWMNRLTSDTVVVAEGLTLILPNVAGMLIKLIGALALIVVLVPKFTYILIPGGALLATLTYAFRKTLKRLHKRVQESDGKLRVFLSERLSSLLIVRAYACEEQTEEKAGEHMAEHKKTRMRRNHFSNICNIGFAIVMRGAYVCGAVVCGYGILTGTMSYGTFTAVIQLISQIQSPFANITGYLPKYYSMLASAERLMEAEEYKEDTPDGVLPAEDIQRLYESDFAAVGLENAEFTYLPPVYDGDGFSKELMPLILKDINLRIEKGEYVAFTGQSGCGKSTLLKLLLCLYPPDSGRRYIEKSDGDRLELTGSYRRLYAYVPQGNQLMSGTIREIVAFSDGKRMQKEEELWRSLEVACAADFVRELSEGLDTQLGERGMGLSEGQMQRIAIARAICADAPILMLDESTSALDEKTEKQLLFNLRSMTDKTVLIVTHRPAVLAICDKQVMMSEEGIEILQKEVQPNA